MKERHVRGPTCAIDFQALDSLIVRLQDRLKAARRKFSPLMLEAFTEASTFWEIFSATEVSDPSVILINTG